MAEIGVAVAGGVLSAVVMKLSKMLSDEGELLYDVKGKIKSLEKDLQWMQSFLKDAEKKSDDRCLIRNWVSDVTDLAHEAEDIIDTFIIKLASEINSNADKGKFCICIPFITRLPIVRELGRQLQDLKVKSDNILRQREQYDLIELCSTNNVTMSDEMLMELRESSSDRNNEDMVGRDMEMEKLRNELNNEDSGHFILSIYGMGGLGKTTLARNLYNQVNESTPERFHYHAWICVSQSYTTKDLLRKLIKSMGNPDEEILEDSVSSRTMIDYLWKKLSKSSFLVVLDDVWDKNVWESIKDVFPKTNKNGKVIITTRKKEVAEVNYAFVHDLKGLDEKNSWDLFCRKTFQYDTSNPDLKRLGEDMVSKCNGLPLAIITLGGVLSTKFNDIGEWEAVKANIWNQLGKTTLLIDVVLSLSFKDLPDHLRPCLLYVAMFPEDYEIPVWKLILLWEAEGLSQEEVSKSYFDELVGRSLIQKTGEDWIDSTFLVHDLVRDLAIRKANELRFSRFYHKSEEFSLSDTLTQRRLAIYNMDFKTIPNGYTNKWLRTMLLLLGYGFYGSQFSYFNMLLESLCGRFDLLRVLDVKVWGNMPHIQVGKLIHLRYLGLEAIEPFVVSETLGDLKVLQTLYVLSYNDTVTLPETVVKLQNLKHLIGCFDCGGSMGVCIGKLTSLKTLKLAKYKSWCDLDTTILVNLQHLTLGFKGWKRMSREEEECHATNFLPKFNNLSKLRAIDLAMHFSYEVSEILKRCPLITHLKSYDTSEDTGPSKNPDLFEFGTHLIVIQWEWVRVWNFQDFISSLEKLPRLRALQFSVMDNDNQLLCFSEKAFPQLRTLHIKVTAHFPQSRVMPISFFVPESGMPLLRNLYVDVPYSLIVSDRLKEKIIPLRTR